MSNLFYLYGINNKKKELDILGVQKTPVKQWNYKNLNLIYSNVNKSIFEPDIHTLKEHNRVLELFLETSTVLPFSFGTIMNNKEAIEEFLDKHSEEINSLLDEYTGKFEVGLKIVTQEYIVEQKVESERADGKEYLMSFYREHKEKKSRMENIQKSINPLLNLLKEQCYKYTLTHTDQGLAIFNASYLIEKEKYSFYKNAVLDFSQSHSDFIYHFSGPWPPYNFVNIKKNGGWTNGG
ncbi:MAG: GvpL/GvpF family gas vesicle protein [Bacillus sp. (in: firmicutes)]